MRNKNNKNERGEPRVIYQVGDRIRAYTLDGLREGVVKTVSGRGYWVALDNNDGLETFIKAENVVEEVERRGANQEEVEEMKKDKKNGKKSAEKKEPEVEKKSKAPAPAVVQKKLPEGAADPKTCRHDIVERKLGSHGTYEPRGRCYECGAPLEFNEKGEKKISPP